MLRSEIQNTAFASRTTKRETERQSTEKRDVRYGDVELKRKVCLGVFAAPGVSLHQGAAL